MKATATLLGTAPADLLADVHADNDGRRDSIGLAAFENVLSRTARAMLSLELGDRYLISNAAVRQGQDAWINGGLMCSGYPGVDLLEAAATEAACAVFGAQWVDFRPLSGLHATVATVCSLTRPGETVYSISPDHGGHFATRALLESTGRRSRYLAWTAKTMTVDLAMLAQQWAHQPGRMVIFDHGVPLRRLPVAAVREIVGPDTLVVYDASHTLGLIAGGEFQDPLAEGCDVLQGNTHKSFPGAHKGLIAYRDRTLGERASTALGGALVSSQNTGATLANFVTTLEMAEHAHAYAGDMQTNRAALVRALRSLGGRFLVPEDTGPVSQSHVLLVESVAGRGGYDLARDLIGAGIHLNARPVNGRVVLRLGVQEVTRLGMGPTQMRQVAELIVRAAAGDPHVRTEVLALRQQHRRVAYSFDTQLQEVSR